MTFALTLTRQDDRTLVDVEDLQLADLDAAGDHLPRVPSRTLARLLGYDRDRKLIELIERIWTGAERPLMRPVAVETPMPGGGVRRSDAKEYWLTQPQAVALIARSRAQLADAVLSRLIGSYDAAARALAPATAPLIDVRPDVRPDGADMAQTHACAPHAGADMELVVRLAEASMGTLAAEPWWLRIASELARVRPRLARATIERLGRTLRAPLPDVSLPLLTGLARLYQRHLDVAERDDLAPTADATRRPPAR